MTSQVEAELARWLELDTRFGFIDGHVAAPMRHHPQIIINGSSDSMLRAIRRELARCDEFLFSVAFVSAGAIALLKQELVEFGRPGTIVTSDYLGFNKPEAFAELMALGRFGVEARMHESKAYHPKGYLFRHGSHWSAILGSSNLTKPALTVNHEWNLKVSAALGSDLGQQLESLIAHQRASSTPFTSDWLDAYRAAYDAQAVVRETRHLPAWFPLRDVVGGASADQAVEPNRMQRDALQRIADLRSSGATKAVVISATGTGKTVLAALDVRSVDPKRLLFVVHREQIIDRAIEEFQWVLGAPRSDFGKLVGGERDTQSRYTFASIQSLSRPEVLASLAPRAFDYILVDEVHRAGAKSYLRVLQHFEPDFLLGMTATPERTDGFNVFELFGFNVPYEIRLNKALEDDMLCPFHYYGVADAVFDDGTVASVETGLEKLVSSVRVDHLVRALETYGQAGVAPRGLVFCSLTEEARGLAAALNGRAVHGRAVTAIALTGSDPIEVREEAVQALEDGRIQYIFTVDIFNEGVDIPSVNQVVMLRQTQSAIVFVQQLGRGLRKHPDKEYVVVIDFIGNYANNYLIPVALFGDESLNRESLRERLVAAEEAGVIAGLSSVRFDKISQQRVLQSIASTKLDSLANIRKAFDTLSNRLGAPPALADFLRFESADPVLVATARGTYPELVARFTNQPHGMAEPARRALTLLTHEALSAKRPHEAIVVSELALHGRRTEAQLLAAVRLAAPRAEFADVKSALAALDLSFATEQERAKYGEPVAIRNGDGVELSPTTRDALDKSATIRAAFDDLVTTTLDLVAQRYEPTRPFTPGKQYSRKDATRLLNWGKNMSSTIYGYKVHKGTRTCPIFVTMHKSDDISASTAYADELVDVHRLRWYTRSRRTLQSGEVSAIVSNAVAIHVFAQKDDAEGSDFYYLGQATAEDAVQETMNDDNGEPLSVVSMCLRFEAPIESAVFDYFHPVVSV